MIIEDTGIAGRYTSKPGHNRAHEKFWAIFFSDNHCAQMPEDWQHELSNYLFHGFSPGSFHTSLFANDLFSATSTSNPLNEWVWIQAFMYFLFHHAPAQSWGSRAKVEAWLKLTEKKRFDICYAEGLVMTDEEVTFRILETSE